LKQTLHREAVKNINNSTPLTVVCHWELGLTLYRAIEISLQRILELILVSLTLLSANTVNKNK